MKIYVASSWRNARQPIVIGFLRGLGHEVYDFRNPAPGDQGFSWRQCATKEQLTSPARFRDEVLTHPIARDGFAKDMGALRAADATVLVLPCGRSAHLELGFAVDRQKTFVLTDEAIDEPELMYLMCSGIVTTLDELGSVLDRMKCSCSPAKRCDRCGWPLKARVAEGCVVGNCSQRPLPDRRSHCAECGGAL